MLVWEIILHLCGDLYAGEGSLFEMAWDEVLLMGRTLMQDVGTGSDRGD